MLLWRALVGLDVMLFNRVSLAAGICKFGSSPISSLDQPQKLCEKNLLAQAISYTASSVKHGLTLSHTAILSLVRPCSSARDPSTCREAHSFILSSKFMHDLQIKEEHVLMFSTCGCLQGAQQVFSEISHPTSSCTWTAIISACASSGQCEHALNYLYAMQQIGVEANKKTIFENLLKACSSTQSLFSGRRVHKEIVRTGLKINTKLSNMIMNMYVRCNSIEDARRVFDRSTYPDVVSWGTMMMGYALHGHGLCALVLFDNMQDKGIMPNAVVLLGLLKACLRLGDLARAFQAHDQVVRYGFEVDVIVGSMLIDMHNKLGNIEEGHLLFHKLHDRNIVTWGSLIAGYVQHGDGVSALQFFEQMKQMGASLDSFIYSCVFKACNFVNSVGQGKRLHVQLMYCNLKLDIVVGNSLIDMYAKCGELDAANKVFDNMLTRNVVSWGSLIAGYVQHGSSEVALELHKEMQKEGLKPDPHTSTCLLKACGAMGALQIGRSLHEYIVRRRYSADTLNGNALVDMYARCGSLEDAQKVFEGLHSPDLVSWDALIAGLVQHGKSTCALEMFVKMQEKGLQCDDLTYLSTLKACGYVQAVERGRLLHEQIILKGFDADIIVGNALIDMYIKCSCLEEARIVFDKLPKPAVVSWAVMISGYVEHEHIGSAIKLLNKMLCENVYADSTTLLCILKACSKMRSLNPGRQMHSQVLICRYDGNLSIDNTLVDMYAKCGSLQEACKVFDALPNRNAVTWDTLISGYVQYGDGFSALKLWSKMCEEDVTPIKVTFLCTLKACCSTGAIEQGRLLHHYIISSGLETDLTIGNTVLDMYANCGSLEDANQVFDNMKSPDLVSWSIHIAGKAQYGSCTSAMQTLKDLQSQRLKPNEEIFLCLLRACRHAGLVEEGYGCFQSMMKEHGLTPGIEHCSCMVDLLGHMGCLKEATSFIQAMPCEADAVVWTSLIASSNFYGNVELGNFCLNKLAELSYHDSSVYELISKDADFQEDLMTWNELQVVQEAPGVVCNVSGSMVHDCRVEGSSFLVDETSLLQRKGLGQKKEMAYVAFASQLTHSVIKQNNLVGNRCAKQAGVVQQQRVRGDDVKHSMAVCAF